jgi:epoxyqueuosine reductase
MCSSGTDDLPQWIENLIAEQVAVSDVSTRYRAPLIAFARADDPRFDELQALVPDHLHPRDLLPGAQSACAFFIPFAPVVVQANRRGRAASEVWARAYVETNELLAGICRALVARLDERGVRAAWEPPTHYFDPVRLTSTWSHKSVGWIAGLGQFGHHHMLITRAGCAGRLGSIVLDAPLPPTPPPAGSYCAFDRGCRECVRRCPAGALQDDGLDRARCYAQCLANDAAFPAWLADVCGKCAVGPCALQPVETVKKPGF